MQQLPLTTTSDSRKLVEDLYDFLGTLVRGWKLIAVCVAITLALAALYLARVKPVYQASARLLVLQHGGQPLNVASGAANNDNLFQSVDGSSNSLTTHIMIIRSPLIVGRSVVSAGLKDVSAGAVLAGLTVKLPDPSARVLELGYKAGSRDEAVRVLDAVIKSYDKFLQDNYQKNSTQVLTLITKARDELSADLKKLEREYLEFRERNPAHPSDAEGHTFIAQRLEQWNREINQAMLRSLQLKSQLDLGQKLAEDGAGADTISSALSQLSGAPVSPALATDTAPGSGLSPERLEAELVEVELQRRTAESLLEHLRAEQVVPASVPQASDEEVAQAFYAEPEAAELSAELRRARAKFDDASRRSRLLSDPSIATAGKRVKELEGEINQLWQRRRSAILARLAGGGDDQVVRQAAAEVTALKAKEATYRERLAQLKAQRLVQLQGKHDRLARSLGLQHDKVREVREQIARLKGEGDDATSDPRQAQSRAMLRSIEQGLKSVEAMRTEVERRFQQDLSESKKTEIGLLTETNLKNNLERQRVLFYSIVDQLKQAQLVSDFGSVTAQVLDPPVAAESRAPIALVLLAALVVGCGLGAGAVYVANQLDARVRSLPEIRRLLDYRVLGAVSLLPRESQVGVTIGLISHVKPRSRLTETYRSIRTGIELLRRSWPGKVFMVTSVQPGDGKSTTASNLAICLAQSGRRVLLIDSDLRRPSLHTVYGLSRSPGLTQVLRSQVPLTQAVQQSQVENLDFLSAGPEVSNPAELLATERLGTLLAEVREAYDIVIIDSSPLLVVTDPSIVAATVDGILFVVRASVTRRLDAERAQDLLKALGTPVLGLVINGIDCRQGGYGYGYGYGYLYSYGTYDRPGPTGEGDDQSDGARPETVNGQPERPAIAANGNGHHTPDG
jgi:capsular exopolysaccharide synthesis family protein